MKNNEFLKLSAVNAESAARNINRAQQLGYVHELDAKSRVW